MILPSLWRRNPCTLFVRIIEISGDVATPVDACGKSTVEASVKRNDLVINFPFWGFAIQLLIGQGTGRFRLMSAFRLPATSCAILYRQAGPRRLG